MAYTKNNWNNGDAGTPLSAARMNHIETQYDEAIGEIAAEINGTKAGVIATAMALYVKGDVAGSKAYDFTKFGVLPVVTYTGTGWPGRATKIPAGYTGNVRYDSTGYIGAPSPLDMIANDKWDRQTT